MAGRIYIGTSGWSYKAWGRSFYPEEVPERQHFEFYATQFSTVEINATFYRLPAEKTVSGWFEKAPPGFIFAVKGSRGITHYQRLKPEASSPEFFLERIRVLKDRLGPILWQLPPNFTKDPERLQEFLSHLPQGFRYAMEFRHPSWVAPEIHELLSRYGVANVSLSSLRMPMDLRITAPFAYVRFHGLEGGAAHDYTREELQPWSSFLRKCAREGVDAFVYFNNDGNTRAPINAQALIEMVGQAAVRPLPEVRKSA